MFKNLKIAYKICLVILFFAILDSLVSLLTLLHDQQSLLLEDIDEQLIKAAHGVPHAFPSHLLAKSKIQIRQEEMKGILAGHARSEKVDRVQILVLDGDQIIVAANGIPDPDSMDPSTKQPPYPYVRAPEELKNSFVDHQLRVVEHQDHHGAFRTAYVPLVIHREDGKGRILVFSASLNREVVRSFVTWEAIKLLALDAVMQVLGLVVVFVLMIYISRPLTQLVAHTQAMIEADFKFDPERNVQLEAMGASRGDEVGALAKAMAHMESMLASYLVRLQKATAARERIDAELAAAREIQMGMLPRAFPQHKEVDLFAVIEPARSVGGDLYHFFFTGPDRLFVLIGDVSDKGVPAALFMAQVMRLFDSYAHQSGLSLDTIVRRVNEDLCPTNTSQMFVTIFAAFLDLNTGQLEYCDGGHEPPFVLRAEGGAEMIEKTCGIVLGFEPNYSFCLGRLKLSPGDALVLYTDGVTEAMDAEHHLFSAERLQQSLDAQAPGASAETISRGIMADIQDFVRGADQSDDIAVLTVRYWGSMRSMPSSSS